MWKYKYLTEEEGAAALVALNNQTPYIILKSIRCNLDTDLYLGILLKPYYDFTTTENKMFIEITIVTSFSRMSCLDYLHNVKSGSVSNTNYNRQGTHALFIVKEVAFYLLENNYNLIFTVADPRLLKIYKSCKGFYPKYQVQELDSLNQIYTVYPQI